MDTLYTHRRKIFYTAVFLIGLICLISIQSYKHWKGSHYFGTVVNMSESDFIIQTSKGVDYFFDITNQTVVKRGLHRLSALAIGDRVIVFGKGDMDGDIDATLVRIMGHKTEVIARP